MLSMFSLDVFKKSVGVIVIVKYTSPDDPVDRVNLAGSVAELLELAGLVFEGASIPFPGTHIHIHASLKFCNEVPVTS